MDAGNPGHYIKENYKNTKVLEVASNPGFEDVRRAVSEAMTSEAIIVFTQKGNKEQITLAKKILESGKPFIVVSMDFSLVKLSQRAFCL